MGNKTTTANKGFAIAGVPCFADTFVQGGSSVLRMKFSAKNLRHRKPQDRYGQPLKDHPNNMTRLKLILQFVLVFLTVKTFATTWDEPWQDEIIKQADYFVFAKVQSYDEKKGVIIEIIKSLAGSELQKQIEITEFYLLDLCSITDGNGVEFDFDNIYECYFFIKKNAEGQYCIATPTTGFAHVRDGNVYATYRHSYHKALVPVDIYEKTMTGIFNNYHGLSFDKVFISEYVNKWISLKPAAFLEAQIDTFFAQHVALECVYHLHLTDLYPKITPFLNDTSNFHNQVSGARALVSYNTSECKQELLKVIMDTAREHFVQVISLWTLSEFNPIELKKQLLIIEETASTEDNNFGGSIMDPRVCTYFPDLKEAIKKLIEKL